MAHSLGTRVPIIFAAFSVALLVVAATGPVAGRLIDRIGGVELPVTDAEAEQINRNMFEVINARYKSGMLTYDGALTLVSPSGGA